MYPPLAGGNHGGRLIVSSGDDTRYIIERYSNRAGEVKVILPDGSTGGTTELSSLIGHASKDIFENIYAFGLTELQDFETLNSEAVKGRIYSAGTGIGTISLSEVQDNIQTEISNVFKIRGSKPDINALFNKIKNIDLNLREIKNDTKKFDELHNEFEEITTKIEEIENKQNQIRIEFSHTTNSVEVWNDWRNIVEADEELQEIPEIEYFPENGIEILNKNLEKIEQFSNSASEKKEILEKNTIEQSVIKIYEKLLINKEKILDLQKGQDKYTSAVSDLNKLENNLRKDREKLRDSLLEIGPDWNEEKLSKFDYSIPTKEIVRKQHGINEKANEQYSNKLREVQEYERNITNINEEIEELDKHLETGSHQVMDEIKLNEQRKSLQLLRIQFPNLKEKEADLRNLGEKEKLFDLLNINQIKSISKLPIWPVFLLIAAGIFFLIIFFLEDNLIMGITFLVILSVLAIIYYIFAKRGYSATAPESLDDKKTDMSQHRTRIESELQKINNEMILHARICEFEDIPDSQQMENKDTQLQAAITDMLELNELKKQHRALKHKYQNSSEKADTERKNLDELKKIKEEAQEKWRDLLTKKGFDSGLSPDGIIDIFSTIKACMKEQNSIRETKARINEIQEYIDEYETKVKSVLEDCDRKNGEINVVMELEKISEELNQATEDKKKLEQLDINEEKIIVELHNIEMKLNEWEGKNADLLSQGFAESENEFRENAKNWEKRNQLSNEIHQAKQTIRRIIGDGKPYSDLINELKRTSLEDLKDKEQQLKERLDEITNNLLELREKRGGIAKEIEQIEQKEEGSSLRMEKSVNMQKLKEKSNEWSILTLASTIMRKAIEKYEHERQPGVIKEAQSFFSKMTLGRYSRIFAPLDENKIYVEDNDGRRKDIQDLSRGTAEQLYLSLRFGLIREFSKRAQSLPIVFDDILVNFDPERFQAACEAIRELAKTNQILYFTCHPENADLLIKMIDDSKIININETRNYADY